MSGRRTVLARNFSGIRGLLRVSAFLCAVLLCLPVLLWPKFDVLPALSPLTAALSAVARRETAMPLSLLGLPLAALAFFRGRWFCFWLCPMGVLTDLAAVARGPVRFHSRPSLGFGRCLALAALAGSILGWPFVLWLDPLAIFGGAVGALATVSVSLLHLFAVLPLTLALGVSLIRPRLWCDHVCPLGAVQQDFGRAGCFVRRRLFKKKQKQDAPEAAVVAPNAFSGIRVTRRELVAASAGLAAAYACRKVAAANTRSLLIRPPGAGNETRLLQLCIRCGRCFQACSRHIIYPDLGRGGALSLLSPYLKIESDYCGEWCNDCCRVCPTGALIALTLEEKRRVMIGRAVVDKTACLAWNQGENCMVCHEFCPFLAIRLVEQNGVNCPETDTTRCRGCGACQTACPATPKPAIRVHGLVRQALAPPLEADES